MEIIFFLNCAITVVLGHNLGLGLISNLHVSNLGLILGVQDRYVVCHLKYGKYFDNREYRIRSIQFCETDWNSFLVLFNHETKETCELQHIFVDI